MSRKEIIKVPVGSGLGGVASLPGFEPPQGEMTLPQFEERWTGGVVTVPLAWRQLRAEAFRTGIGCLRDPQFGGFDILVFTPDAIAKETREAGLTLLETVGGRYPSKPPRYFTPWYCYVLTREA